MKRLFFLCAGIFLTLSANAQILNPGFEARNPDGTPQKWQPSTMQVFVLDTNCISLGWDSIRISTHDAHSGSYAYELRVATACSTAYSGNIMPTLYNADTAFVDQRVPFTRLPAAITFYYKLLSVQGDQGYAEAFFEDSTANGLGDGRIKLSSATTWTKATLPIHYTSPGSSGFLRLSFSLRSDSVLHFGSRFRIDDLNTIGTAGINSLTQYTEPLTCYPQPAKDNLFIKLNDLNNAQMAQLIITDALGRTVQSSQVIPLGNTIEINTGTFIPGIYYARLMQAGNTAVGRFVKQ